MLSVADLISPSTARSWHEAVAVVQEVASQTTPGQPIPAPQDLLIADSGAITFGFASESGEDSVVGLARLLQSLLEGTEPPAPLRDLAAENSRVPSAHSTVEGFTRALSFFERPNRSADLAAVASRLRQAVQQSDTDAEFERLRRKVAKVEERPSEQPAEKRLAKFAKRPPMIVAALAGGIIFTGASLSRGVFQGNMSRAVGQAGDTAARAVSTALDRVGGALGLAPANEAAVVTAAKADANLPVERRPKNSARPIVQSMGDRDEARDSTTLVPQLQPRARPQELVQQLATSPPLAPAAAPHVPPTDPRAPMPAPVAEVSKVYSTADPAVLPAMLTRPQLPSQPAPGAETGYFDILVNERGRVETVRLVSPTRRYYDRMMVAAAKAWIFKPALLNGKPVKYRIQIPIIGPATW